MENKKAYLYLEDGSTLTGNSFGASGESIGEIVFNTSMTGYQEILTDPSYYQQLVVMTYPLIGNYGTNFKDFESIKPRVFGFIVREFAEFPSHYQSVKDISQYLIEHNIIGISNIDTRMLTKKIRSEGTMKALITTNELSKEEVVIKLKTPLKTDQVAQVTVKQHFILPGKDLRIVLVDYGYKQGIVRELIKRECEITIVPYNTSFEQIKLLNPDGILFSNGPGDPKDVIGADELLTGIIKDKIPFFGVCLGHQLFALANGADTEKLKYGHRGANHPVKELETNKVYITSQNHGYTVKRESLNSEIFKITHLAVNDQTIEGLEHLKAPAFSVQYHPESSPGPDDNSYLFDKFIQLIRKNKEEKLNA